MAYGTSGALSALGTQPTAPARERTELEQVIGEVREHLINTIESARSIACRVLPPTPEKGNDTVSPVAVTYLQQVREVACLADTLRGIVGELNGRI